MSLPTALIVGPACLTVAFILRWRIGLDPYAFDGLPLYFISFCIGGFGVHGSFIVPNILMMQEVPSHKVGSITSLMHAAREGLNVPIPTLIFAAFAVSPQTPYLMGASILLAPLSLSLAWRYHRPFAYRATKRFTEARINIALLTQATACSACFCVACAAFSSRKYTLLVPSVCLCFASSLGPTWWRRSVFKRRQR